MKADIGWQKYWRYLTARFRDDVEDEIEFHIAMRARELEAQGMSSQMAEHEARRRFGDREQVRTTLHRIEQRRGRRMRLTFLFHELRQDIHYGARALLKRPGFALMTAGSLALGIAAVTVVLSVIDAYLLRPLPVRNPQELVVIGATNRASSGMAAGVVGLPTVRDIATRADLFQGVAAHSLVVGASRRSEGDAPERGVFLTVTGNYFSVLGVQAALGRTLVPDDDRLRERVIVLSHRAWQSRFAGDSAIIGQTVRVNAVEFVVVGVAPAEFHGTEFIFDPAGYIPIGVLTALDPGASDIESRRNSSRFTVIARRRADRSLADIRSAMETLAKETERAYPAVGEDYRLPVFLESRSRPTLPAAGAMTAVAAVFATLALLVLVTASVNATNLILARGSTRSTELAVRQALGASRGRLVRQLLVEVLLVALLAFVGALGMARAAIGALTAIPFTFDDLPLSFGIHLDARVFVMTLAFTLIVGLVAGLGPSLSASGFALQQRLREGGRSGLTRSSHRARGALVVAQVAASLVVLVCAGLFVASAKQAGRVDLGFRSDHLLTLGVDANLAHYDESSARRALDLIVRAVAEVPGASSAAWSSGVPIKKGAALMGEVQGDGASPIGVFGSDVGPGYFDVMQIPVLEGRGILATDDSTHGGVVVINQRAAEQLWPGQSALGRNIRLDRTGPSMEVIGIVKNGRYLLIGESPRPYMYRSLAQHYSPAVFLNVRTSADPAEMIASVRSAVSSVSRDLTPFDVHTMDDVLDASPNGTLLLRVGAGFATVVGGLAVALTLVGLYGVIAFSVVQRTREIGLRMALGASRWTVVRSILTDGAKLAAGGIVVGIVFAVLVSRMVGGLLVGSRSADVAIFTAVAIGLAVAALLAAYIPAYRASRIDPVKAIAEG